MGGPMSISRFTAAGVKILERTASEEELNDYITEATRAKSAEPSLEKQLVETEAMLEKERNEAHQLQEALNRAVGENDKLRKQLDDLPSWLRDRAIGDLTDEQRASLVASKQWVMLVSPGADYVSWFTLATHIMRFDTAGHLLANGWGVIVGTWSPNTRNPDDLKGY